MCWSRSPWRAPQPSATACWPPRSGGERCSRWATTSGTFPSPGSPGTSSPPELLGPIQRVDLRQSAGGRWPYASTAVLSPSRGRGRAAGLRRPPLRPARSGGSARSSRCATATTPRAGWSRSVKASCCCRVAAPIDLVLSRSRALRDTVVVEGERGTVEIGVFEPAVVRLTPRRRRDPGRHRTGSAASSGRPSAPCSTASSPTSSARLGARVAAGRRHRGPPGRRPGGSVLRPA